MKKPILSIVCLFIGFNFLLNAQIESDIIIQKYSTLDQSYIELYTYIINPYKELTEEEQRNIESLVVIRDENQIQVAEKYLYCFTQNTSTDLLDIKRFQLDPGEYSVRVELIDLEDINLYDDHSFTINLKPQDSTSLASSDLLLGFESSNQLDQIEKLSVPIEPMVFNFCRNQESMLSYVELYNLDQYQEPVFAGYKLHRLISQDSSELVFKKFEKLANEPFVPLLVSFPMEEILSGQYILDFELIDKKSNVLYAMNRSFDVSNAKADLEYSMSYNMDFENSWVQRLNNEELDYALKAIFPRLSFSSTDVVNYVLDQNDIKVKRYFLFNFWVTESPDYPEEIFNRYMEIARAVDKTYQGSLGYGFESDRGYIFLKYGKPSDIVSVEDEPTAHPYEIWMYNHLEETNQTEVKFLFYNQSLASNDMILLHSTCRGELSNPRWELELYGDDPNTANINPIDGRNANPGFNRRAREYFTDF